MSVEYGASHFVSSRSQSACRATAGMTIKMRLRIILMPALFRHAVLEASLVFADDNYATGG